MLAYLNGNWIDYSSATVPVWDYGFAMGVSVTEQLRTFNGELFCQDWHIDRLLNGLAIIGMEPPLDRAQLNELVQQVVDRNWNDIPSGGDMGVGLCITPGPLTKFSPTSMKSYVSPTVLAFGYSLDFSGLVEIYEKGMSLAISETREVPDACVPRQLKCRSRMHYYLAEQESAKKHPGSRALLLDLEGNIAEATVATVVMVEQGVIVVPPAAMILPSTTLRYLLGLCEQEGIEVSREPISPERLSMADEVLWLSSPVTMLPVTRLNGEAISSGCPGETFKHLLDRWSKSVGINLVAQAECHIA